MVVVVNIWVRTAVGFSPIDFMVDIASLAVGYDVVTGEELDDFAKGALAAGLVVGLVTGGIGDDLMMAGLRGMRFAEDMVDASRAVLRQGDELLQAAGRGLSRRVDGLVQAGGRHLDDLLANRRIARRLDDWVSPDGVEARLGREAPHPACQSPTR